VGETVVSGGPGGQVPGFASVVDAVRWVIELEAAMAERAADVPEDRRIAAVTLALVRR